MVEMPPREAAIESGSTKIDLLQIVFYNIAALQPWSKSLKARILENDYLVKL